MSAAIMTQIEARIAGRSLLSDGILPGAIGGVVGGLVFGAANTELGSLPSIASLVRLDVAFVGYLIHMAIAVVVGVGLGMLVWHLRLGVGETLFWGMVYGTFWWFIGALTLRPLILFEGPGWTVEGAQAAFPALIGHILYGASAGLTIVLLQLSRHRSDETAQIDFGAMTRGGLAGIIAASIVGTVLNAQGRLHTFVAMPNDESRMLMWGLALGVGLFAGLCYSLMYPRPMDSAGAGIIRGAAYGFLAWTILPLTLLPLMDGSVLPWRLDEVRSAFANLPGYLLFGAAMSLIYQWLGALKRIFFDDATIGGDEGAGIRGLRAMGRGMAAGIIGGFIFAAVMIQIGALTNVAGLIRVSSPVVGFFVHMTIAVTIGTTFGLFFRRQIYDLPSALGWGASYGFIWWMLGPMTLFPTFLGITPTWTVEVVARIIPNLIGHLLYGAGLGVTLHILEARYSPWWIPRRQAQAARIERRREQALTSAPALWTFIVVVALTLPILLGTDPSAPSVPGIY